jgi:hypothetical protein
MSARTNAKWGLWIAAACLTGMTTTASAQLESKPGPSGAGPASSGGATSGSAASADLSSAGTLSGEGAALIKPHYAGWCGTPDWTRRDHQQVLHMQRYLAALALRTALQLEPGHALVHLAVARLWIASTSGVQEP